LGKKATFKRPKVLDAWRVGARKPTTLQGTSTLVPGNPFGEGLGKKATFKRPKVLDAWRVSARKPTTLQGTSTLEGCSDLALIYLRTGMFINIK
jgi:hypothetical protein